MTLGEARGGDEGRIRTQARVCIYSVRNGVLLQKHLIRLMMDYVCPIWRSAARSHVRNLQVLQSMCLRIATNAPWYVGNRQIHEDLGIPFFADHIRALNESFDSKFANAGNPLVRQLGRHLCRPRADWSHPRMTEVDWCWADQPRLSLKKKGGQVGATSSLQLLGYPDRSFPCFSSALRQMPGYNSKGARPAFPNHGGLHLMWLLQKVAEAISQRDSNTSGFNSQRAIQPKAFSQRTNCLMGQSLTSSNNPLFEKVNAIRHDNNPVSVSTLPDIVLRHLLPFPAMRFVRRNGQT
jgi:hypothetical protein